MSFSQLPEWLNFQQVQEMATVAAGAVPHVIPWYGSVKAYWSQQSEPEIRKRLQKGMANTNFESSQCFDVTENALIFTKTKLRIPYSQFQQDKENFADAYEWSKKVKVNWDCDGGGDETILEHLKDGEFFRFVCKKDWKYYSYT
eukprot:UN22596